MGKRSSYERRPADFYPTPRAAVAPLIPHLRGVRTFAELCAGDGALVRLLESFRLTSRSLRREVGSCCMRSMARTRARGADATSRTEMMMYSGPAPTE